MAIAVIADCHVGGEGGAVDPLVAQLDALAPGSCERLVLLGDVFLAWMGLRRFETPQIRLFLDAVGRLRRRGVPVTYIEGNRDFYLRSTYGDDFDGIVDRFAFEAGGRRFLAVHGDGLDPTDRQYRFWRFLSKNPVSRLVARLVPTSLGQRIVERTERRLAETNFRHKIRVPEAALVAFARRELAAGCDTVLYGHYHDPQVWTLPQGEVRVLEAWFHERRIHWFG
jgi:UDP-2,3-diacylglucosamine hydrolase